jgi:hypothetical protein
LDNIFNLFSKITNLNKTPTFDKENFSEDLKDFLKKSLEMYILI